MVDIRILIGKITKFLDRAKSRRLIIQTHDIPDPDAIASAEAFRVMARHLGVKAIIVSNGFPQRRENRMLLRECMITLKPLESLKIKRPEHYAWAYIDCLPGGGNVTIHPLAPGDLFLAIDHHDGPKSALKFDPGDFSSRIPKRAPRRPFLAKPLSKWAFPYLRGSLRPCPTPS